MSAQIIGNRYQILQSLGEGGFGQTFLAVDLHLPTKPQCVVKKLQPQDKTAENLALAARLFEQEAEVQCRLGTHPNIPTLLAHFEFEGEFYLVQELIAGETLAQEFDRGRKYSEAEAIYLLDQILETLAFVHHQNIIHRDLKPTNLIRRNSDGKIFIIDFGAVKQVNVNPFKNAASFHSTIAIGSAGFTPSEQAAGKPCFASDLYAAGLVVIQALTLIHPLQLSQNRNTGEFVWQHKTVLRAEVMNLIAKLVRYDYRQRWYSAKEAFASLHVIRTSLGYQKRVEQPRVLQPTQLVIRPQIRQPIIQPIHSESTKDSLGVSMATAPKLESPPLMPTVVQFTSSNFPNRYNQPATNGILNDVWDSHLKLGVIITLVGFVFVLISGFAIVSVFYSVKSDLEKDRAEKNQSQNPTLTATQNMAFEEATKLAIEAETLSKNASTKYEWQEVANKYQRAEILLKSINSTDEIAPLAGKKIIEYKASADYALTRVAEIQNALATNIPNIKSSSPLQPSSTPSYTNYPTQTTSSTPAPVIKKAKMPGRQKGKLYLAFNSSTGDYIGQAQNKVFNDRDGNFSTQVNYHSGVTIRFDGGPDSWTLDLAAPQKVKLTSGSYNGAQRFPFQSPTRPGLSFSGSGRGCNESLGNFTINNIIYSLDDKYIFLLDATFVQNCGVGNSPIMGRVYYDVRQ